MDDVVPIIAQAKKLAAAEGVSRGHPDLDRLCILIIALFAACDDRAKPLPRPATVSRGTAFSCGGEELETCIHRAEIWLGSNRPDRGPAQAASMFGDACKTGSARACTYLGKITITGWGAHQNTAKGVALLDAACEGGEPHACQLAAVFAESAASRQRLQDRARQLLEATCAKGDAGYCGELALDLAREEGGSRTASTDRQRELFEIACKAGQAGFCFGLAQLEVTRGNDGAPHVRRAITLIEPACRGGDALRCDDLATMFAALGDDSRSLELRRTACDGGYSPACLELVSSCERREPSDCQTLVDRFCGGWDLLACAHCLDAPGERCGSAVRGDAEVVLASGCDRGIGAACTALSKHATALPDRARYLERGCDHGDLLACLELAKNAGPTRQRELRRRVCIAGGPSACER